MILKKIKIMNYRQLESVELDMQESLTVLVGPNNSGKTTLISVLKGMFCDKKLGFSYSDIPISLSSMWLEKTVPVFQEIMLEYDKEKGVQKIIDEMTDNDKLSKDYTIDNFRAQIQVDYDPDSDNIQYFADYLMDLDDTKHSFYFIYTYEPSITAFEKGLNERYNRMAARVRDIENPGCIEKETKFYFLKEELLRIYCNAVIEKCYFCNSNYKNENSMEVAAFKSLFNFQNIPAMRELDDNESDSSKGISKRVIASDVYEKMLQDPEFCAILEELVDFGISRYKVNYSYHYQDTNLVLYQKYTYEDACRLLNWERNEVPLNIGGYKYDKKTKTFPIFINYDKQDNISDTTKYEDHFVAENRLIAISKSGRSMDSEDVQNFLNATERGIDVQLFVRKNKDDKISKEFYYLGRVIATGNAKQFVMPNTDKTAVEIEWELETPVREDIYQYIVNE